MLATVGSFSPENSSGIVIASSWVYDQYTTNPNGQGISPPWRRSIFIAARVATTLNLVPLQATKRAPQSKTYDTGTAHEKVQSRRD
ncbi:cytochrome p450 [Anopheles sinensis]|uniref:Cytochrome p450 n=1 Tax=Anopheles sinensis TaxID=74873 RepID=A0A084WQY7_ANOSI|nr:cytochrome p450 [Anopheles sinensis]